MKEWIDAYVNVWKNYVNFKGTATRSDYWKFFAVNIIASWVIGLVGGVLSSLYSLAIFLPTLAVAIRRFRDADKLKQGIICFGVAFVSVIAMVIVAFVGAAGAMAGAATMTDSAQIASLIASIAGPAVIFGLVALGAAIWELVILCTPTAEKNKVIPEAVAEVEEAK